MYDYVAGLDLMARLPQDRPLPVGRDHLLDLLCYLLSLEAQELLDRGLYADYRVENDALPVVRGRLRILDQATRRFGRVDTLECEFEEHDTDNVDNQLVAAGLSAAARHAADEDVRRGVRRLSSIFAAACTVSRYDVPYYSERISYTRRNHGYRTAHQLSYLLLEHLAVRELYADGTPRCFAFLIDMNVLFERFVSRLVSDAFSGSTVRVRVQRRDRSVIVHEDTGRSYGTVIPDLLLEEPGQWRLPGDAKYKLYDRRRLDPTDIYQVFLYAYAFHHGLPVPTGFLVYPAQAPAGPAPRLRVQNLLGAASARIVGWPVDVPASLAAIRSGAATRHELHASVRAAIRQTL